MQVSSNETICNSIVAVQIFEFDLDSGRVWESMGEDRH